ncbi:MAG: hypothetical protein LBQ55_02905 [Treponema sp.]|jgi:hypothetical protein|nr:hypothetical protein [Treponema sp.]
MFITVVVITAVTGILFLALAVSLSVFIYSNVTKKEGPRKKSLRVLIPTAIVWVLLAGVNAVFIVTLVVKNREAIIDKAVRIPAEMAGKGLALTFQSFEQSWDQNRLLQLEKLRVSASSLSWEDGENGRVYDIGLIFDNDSPEDIKLYLDDLIGNHYLLAGDRDDFVYPMKIADRPMSSVSTERTVEQRTGNAEAGTTERTTTYSTEYANTIIPFGKSRFRFTLTVPADVEITHVSYAGTSIPFK